MPRPLIKDGQDGFGTLNLTSDPAHLGPREVQLAVNAKPTLFGGMQPRDGSQLVQSFTSGVQNGMIWQNSPNGVPQMLVVSGGQLWTTAMPGAPPWKTSPTLIGPCSTFAYPPMVAFVDGSGTECVYIGDPAGLWKWNGTALTKIVQAPSFSFQALAVQNQRLFGIANNTSATPSFNQTLFWSSLNNGDDCGLPTAGQPQKGSSAIIRTFGESFLTDLVAFGPGLVIGHFAGLSMWTGWSQDDISIQSGTHGISAETGVFGPHSMCTVESYGFLASDHGAYTVNPWGMLSQVSKPLEKIWPSIIGQPQYGSSVGFLNPTVTVLHNQQARSVYFLTPANSSGLVPNSIYGYNYRTESWFGPWTYGFGVVTSLWDGYDQKGNYYVMAGGLNGGVRQIEVPGLGIDNYDATGLSIANNQTYSYTAQIMSRPFFGRDMQGQPLIDTEKAWRYVDVAAQLPNPASSTINVISYPTQSVTTINPLRNLSQSPVGDTSPRNYRLQAGVRGQACVILIQDTPPANTANGQNTYTSAKAVGWDYGRRY